MENIGKIALLHRIKVNSHRNRYDEIAFVRSIHSLEVKLTTRYCVWWLRVSHSKSFQSFLVFAQIGSFFLLSTSSCCCLEVAPTPYKLEQEYKNSKNASKITKPRNAQNFIFKSNAQLRRSKMRPSVPLLVKVVSKILLTRQFC